MDPYDLWQFKNLEKSGENRRKKTKNLRTIREQMVEKYRFFHVEGSFLKFERRSSAGRASEEGGV